MTCTYCARARERMAAKVAEVLEWRRKRAAAKQQAEAPRPQHEQQGVEAAEGSSPDEGREHLPGVQEGGAGE